MDHGFWPMLTVALYLNEAGDLDFLLEERSYFSDGLPWRGEWPRRKAEAPARRGTVLEHILTELTTAFFDVGEHGFMRLRGEDWNDALDMARERGETVRMMLTGQVFAVLSGAADRGKLHEIVRAVDWYLDGPTRGGYCLNTDFGEVKLDMGRMFGFAYGSKENGAVFSHMGEERMAMFDEKGRYIIRDYQSKPAFSSFLPGIAGPMGVPVWGATTTTGGRRYAASGRGTGIMPSWSSPRPTAPTGTWRGAVFAPSAG